MSRLLPILFLMLCGPLGIFLAVNTAPGQVPDEYTHVVKADSLLHGEWFGHRQVVATADGLRLQQGVDGDPALQGVSAETTPAQLTSQRWATVNAVPWSRTTFLPIWTIAGYWPVFYIPAAVALGFAKAVGLTPFEAFLCARIAGLLVYLGLGTTALALTRRGQALLFCTLCVPMSLHLGASINQDGLVIAASVLAVALLTRTPSSEAATHILRRHASRIGAAIALGSVILAKPPYLPLAGALLLPLPALAERRAWLVRVALLAAVAVATLAWTWITVHFVATPVIRPPAEAGPLWPGPRPAIFPGTDMAGQMRVLMAKPVRFLTLPWESIRNDGFMLDQAIGVLAYLNLFLPPWLYVTWKVALVSAAAADVVDRRPDAEALPLWQAPIPLLCVAAALVAIYLSQYLSWTPVGDRHIIGPQGRYWLPLLPFVAFALPDTPQLPRLGAALLIAPLAAAVADVFALPGVVIRFFYMH